MPRPLTAIVFCRLFALFAASVLLSCGRAALTADMISPREKNFIVWAHSDIQPNFPAEKVQYETAVRDLATLPFVPDAAVVAGDLVHRLDSQNYWNWMKELRAQTKIPLWYEIAGNHDLNDPASYARNSGKPRHYAVRCGNILFIFLSDEIRSAVTDISDGAFEWWKDLVVNNQDSIIVTVTHAALPQSGLISTVNWTMSIEKPDRFWNVIKKYSVDVWLSGHSHLPNYLAIKSTEPEGCRTLFLDVSSIHKNVGSPIESWILVFRDGSRTFQCVPRNHEEGEFYSRTSVRRELSRPFSMKDRNAAIVSRFE
jgi:hypothetical protein